MKKFLVVLLSLGLIAAFAMTASAADVKFSGQYYVNGVYQDNRALQNDNARTSRAFFFTRTRVQTVFGVTEGLSFTTRFDAFEKQWGNTNWNGGQVDQSNSSNANVAQPLRRTDAPNNQPAHTNPRLQENLEMEYGFVTFKTKAGQFDVGYQSAGTWGTRFGDNPSSRPRIKLTTPFGPFTMLAIYEKNFEADVDRTVPALGKVDADADSYMLAGVYRFKGGNAGLLYVYSNDRSQRAALNRRTTIHTLAPYMTGTFGPVFVEAEVIYQFGKAREFEAPAVGPDVDQDGLGAYILGRFNMGPAYFGAQYGYSSGDDFTDPTKSTTGPASSTSWVPNLLWGEANLNVWAMGIGGQNPNKQNLHLYGVFAGYNPTPKMNVEMSFNAMKADKLDGRVGAVARGGKDYGMELDLKASYKIYDNLTYMVGAAYLWTGDFYKTVANPDPANDYLLMNQLTLNF